MKVRLIAEARDEFLHEVAYYEDLRTGLGKRFHTAATTAFKRAGESPMTGKPGVAGTRRVLVKGFPFAVVYAAEESAVVVYAVAHLSRRPGYWFDRLGGDG